MCLESFWLGCKWFTQFLMKHIQKTFENIMGTVENAGNYIMVFALDRFENIVEKGENTGIKHFLLFPPCF